MNPEKLLLNQWGFESKKKFAEFLRDRLQDLDIPAQALIHLFEKELEKWILERLAGQPERFVAAIEFPPPAPGAIGGSNLLKRPERVAEKILKSWLDFQRWEKASQKIRGKIPPHRHDPQGFLGTIPDVIRFRIVCNYLGDLRFMDKKLHDFARRDPRLQTVNREDHIARVYPNSRPGHKAIEYTIRFKGKEGRFLFEAQIMTQLQHAWDKKDHHLIYEHTRSGRGDRIPGHLKNRVAAMSELLYAADTIFDRLLEEITVILKPETRG
jgi:ppGpp synthetase/RelA/SpoT-type nucleotidyltranferase